PGYMGPTEYVMLESLPLSPNGKVDRQALPAPRRRGEELEKCAMGYHNPVQKMLAEIWGEILKREWIGVEENFFELGGHSLMATRVVSRVRATFAVELTLKELFAAPTIEGLAEILEGALLAKSSSEELAELLDIQ